MGCLLHFSYNVTSSKPQREGKTKNHPPTVISAITLEKYITFACHYFPHKSEKKDSFSVLKIFSRFFGLPPPPPSPESSESLSSSSSISSSSSSSISSQSSPLSSPFAFPFVGTPPKPRFE
mmetsp:Transcript_11270/g.24039  ORF Transcript_11270/g.24039 Transcript_11270/m.24039 type:complete len:121 (+) Transcript_11270:13-375(+)